MLTSQINEILNRAISKTATMLSIESPGKVASKFTGNNGTQQ